MNTVVGYCIIKNNSTTGISAAPMSDFEGEFCRVLEFGQDECVLIVNRKATALATFDKCDVASSFKCANFGEIIIPPGLNEIEKIQYAMKLQNRKGGYCSIVRNMVIAASLNKGEYTDNFLFQKQ